MSAASTRAKSGSGSPIACPGARAASEHPSHGAAEASPSSPSCPHMRCAENGMNGEDAMARERAAFTE